MSYIPEGCNTLAELPPPQIRLGIQGYGGTGKTWGALTFPNPIVFNIDNGLGAHVGRPDIVEVPIWNPEYCKKVFGQAGYTKYNLRDVVDKWFDVYAPKLEKDQTLIIDGSTGLQNCYHLWYSVNIVVGSNNKVNEFGEWKLKQQFFTPLLESLKYLKCNVIYICHEAEKKEKSGNYEGKIRPLLSGAVGDELLGHFTDFFRAHAAPKSIPNPDKLPLWKLNEKEFKDMMATYSGDTVYYWETEGSEVFDAKRSSLVDAPRFLPACYSSFLKYRRKYNETSIEENLHQLKSAFK